MKPWVAIVGAGPAGMHAAMAAYRRGCRVTVVDEAGRPGGQIYRQPSAELHVAAVAETTEEQRKLMVLDAFSAICDDLDYRASTGVYAAFRGPELHLTHTGTSTTLRPDAVVFTTGVRERVIPFPGWTLPGVVAAGGAQAQVKSHGVRPGNRAVVAGAGPLPLVLDSSSQANGAMRVVPGSQDFDRAIGLPNETDIHPHEVALVTEPGDATAHLSGLWHCSPLGWETGVKGRRRTLSLTYVEKLPESRPAKYRPGTGTGLISEGPVRP